MRTRALAGIGLMFRDNKSFDDEVVSLLFLLPDNCAHCSRVLGLCGSPNKKKPIVNRVKNTSEP